MVAEPLSLEVWPATWAEDVCGAAAFAVERMAMGDELAIALGSLELLVVAAAVALGAPPPPPPEPLFDLCNLAMWRAVTTE